MIRFDANKIKVAFVQLKTCTVALGGSISIVDEQETAKRGKEKLVRVQVPYSLARRFAKTHGSQFLRPVLVCIVSYDGMVMSLERHLNDDGNSVTNDFRDHAEKWSSYSERGLTRAVLPATANGEWWCDGRYVYTFKDTLAEVVRNGEKLTQDGKFRAIECSAFDMQDLSLSTSHNMQPSARFCVAFIRSDRKGSMTPPVWTNVPTRRSGSDFAFDDIDANYAVNLSFVLKAGRDLADIYGYEILAPLDIPELMLQMNTVNLPRLPSHVKDVTACSLPFLHALAWLMGLMSRVQSIDSYTTIRGLLSHLLKGGLVTKKVLAPSSIYRGGVAVTPQLVSIAAALNNASTMSVEDKVAALTSTIGSQRAEQLFDENVTVDF